MKKILICIPVIIFLMGCEKDYDSVVEPDIPDYQVLSVPSFSEFEYIPGDSTKTLNITFNNSADVKNVSYELFSPSGKKLTASPVYFSEISENIFSAVLRMSKSYENGFYTIKYMITDISGNTREAAVQRFRYDNGTGNTPPVITDALIEPDTLVVTDTTAIHVSVRASDADGQSDIDLVYFLVYRPNGTTSGNQNILYDNGDPGKGDITAGDGIYSLIIQVNQDNVKGTYRFEFRARDRAKQTSNVISYNVLIQ